MEEFEALQVEQLYYKYLYYELGVSGISDYNYDMLERKSFAEAQKLGFKADKWEDPDENEKHHVHWMVGFDKKSKYWPQVVEKYNLEDEST